MRRLASDGPSGKLFFNSTAASPIGATLATTTGDLCNFAQLSLETRPERLIVARGGIGGGSYIATWNFGDDPVNVRVYGTSSNDTMLVPEGRSTFSLGSSQTKVGNKWHIVVPTETETAFGLSKEVRVDLPTFKPSAVG